VFNAEQTKVRHAVLHLSLCSVQINSIVSFVAAATCTKKAAASAAAAAAAVRSTSARETSAIADRKN